MLRITNKDFLVVIPLAAILVCSSGQTSSVNYKLKPTISLFDYEGKRPIDNVPIVHRGEKQSIRDRIADRLIAQRDWIATNKELTTINSEIKELGVLLAKEDKDSLKEKILKVMPLKDNKNLGVTVKVIKGTQGERADLRVTFTW